MLSRSMLREHCMAHTDLTGKEVLVTGGAGFIGSHLAEELVSRGALVTVVDNLRTGHVSNLARCLDRIRLVTCDVLSEPFDELLTGHPFDIVYHLAANAYVPPSVECPSFDLENNLLTTFRILEHMRQGACTGALIFASSGAVYGNPVRLPICETDSTIPVSPYGVGKLAAERYVDVFCRLYGLRGASLRLFSAFGPRQAKQIVYDFLVKLDDDPTSLFIHGDGSQTRDFNYVTNIVDALLLVAERGELTGEVYNVASGRVCSVRELAAIVCAQLALTPHHVFSGSVRPGDADKWAVNIDRLLRLGYRPNVSLEQGIARTIEWYKSARSAQADQPVPQAGR